MCLEIKLWSIASEWLLHTLDKIACTRLFDIKTNQMRFVECMKGYGHLLYNLCTHLQEVRHDIGHAPKHHGKSPP